MIVGITQPDSGRVLICGEDLSHRLTTTKRHLGYLPEDVLPYDRLTGREYIELIAGLKEANPTQITEEIEFFELGPFQNKLAGSYSHGMRQKLGLAAAMIGAPDVLVLDEPLNGLDVEMMRKLRGRVESERTEGKAILISSHVMSFTERVCNRVGIMKAGRLVAEGSPEELREMAKMSKEPFEDVFFHWA
jgi:ABC-2 type transport system ATP-binding protein